MGSRKQQRTCRTCGVPVVLVRADGRHRRITLAVDPEPSPAGTVAAYRTSAGGLLGRFLGKADQPYGYERRYAQHQCPPATPQPAQPASPKPPTLFDT